jgi:hypothetical protein
MLSSPEKNCKPFLRVFAFFSAFLRLSQNPVGFGKPRAVSRQQTFGLQAAKHAFIWKLSQKLKFWEKLWKKRLKGRFFL